MKNDDAIMEDIKKGNEDKSEVIQKESHGIQVKAETEERSI